MRKIALAILLFLAGVPAYGQNVRVVTTCGNVSPLTPNPFAASATLPALLTINTNGQLCGVFSGTITPSGTQDVNLTQVGGATVATGNGTAAGTIRVALPTDGTGVVQPGNTANTIPWLTTNTPSTASGAATTRASSTAAESNRVLKASAGNLYDLKVTIGATTGWVMLFDATALPSNGAVTPVWCEYVLSTGTAGGIAVAFPTPMPFATGITAGFSSTGCYTLTASATAAFFGGYK